MFIGGDALRLKVTGLMNKDSTLQGHTGLRLEFERFSRVALRGSNSTREPFAINQGTFTFVGEQFWGRAARAP